MWGGPALVSGASGRGSGPLFAVYPLLFLRWSHLYRVCGGFVFLFSLSLLLWFRVISFLVSRLVLGLLLCGGFVFVSSYSGVSYSDHASKLTILRIARKCRKKCKASCAFLPRLNIYPILLGLKSHGPAGRQAGSLATIDLSGRNRYPNSYPGPGEKGGPHHSYVIRTAWRIVYTFRGCRLSLLTGKRNKRGAYLNIYREISPGRQSAVRHPSSGAQL